MLKVSRISAISKMTKTSLQTINHVGNKDGLSVWASGWRGRRGRDRMVVCQ